MLCHKLHGFSDASEKAYAAVVYLRTVYDDGKTINTNIIASKNRVAPLKKQTIPRLKLLGATILARLLHSVKSELEPIITLSGCYHWVDSFTIHCAESRMNVTGSSMFSIVLMKSAEFHTRTLGNSAQDLITQLTFHLVQWMPPTLSTICFGRIICKTLGNYNK